MSAQREREHRLAAVAAELLGAAAYLDDHPGYATDEVLADRWRRYVAQLREVTEVRDTADADAGGSPSWA